MLPEVDGAGWLQLGAGNLNLRKIARGNSNTFCILSSISLAVINTASNIVSNHILASYPRISNSWDERKRDALLPYQWAYDKSNPAPEYMAYFTFSRHCAVEL